MEIIAVAKDFGYCTMEQVRVTRYLQIMLATNHIFQHYWGTSTDGHDFDFKFRITSLLKKIDGRWKWVHEHVSFPVNIATKIADFTCSQHATEHLKMKEGGI